jgi:hypothetical protein
VDLKWLCPLENPLSIKIKVFFPQTVIFQKFKYIFIINMSVCNSTNRLKYKKRKIRRQRKVRYEKNKKNKKNKKRITKIKDQKLYKKGKNKKVRVYGRTGT